MDFLWGAATSAHQVEGGTHNQWTVWELENAKTLAHAAEYRLGHLPRWPEVKAEATDPGNYVSGKSTDHYHRYEADFDLAASLHLNAFRFSIEWSRCEPEEGRWDPAEVDHYRRYIAAMKRRGLQPLLTLYHWTVPVWFAEKGGFEKARNIRYFVRFAEKVLLELGTELSYITTINEPDTVASHGYLTLDHPPQKHSYWRAFWVYRNLLLAHKRVYRLAKRMNSRLQVGFSKSYAYAYTEQPDRLSRLAVRLDYLLRDDVVLGYVGRATDFLGINYYFCDRYVGRRIKNDNHQQSDLGWEMQPRHLEQVLLRLATRHKRCALIVSESGVADSRDVHRKAWIALSLQAIQRAMAAGADVRGYLHWSLLDNFEWAYGRWPRFGLVAIDYATLKRTIRPSGRWYGRIVKQLRN